MLERRFMLLSLHRFVPFFVLSVLLTAGGCSIFHRTPPPPPAPPALTVDVSPYVGSPLSGPTTAPTPTFADADALQIDVDWTALQKFPGDELLPLDAQSNLTSAPLASGPVLTVGQSTRLIRFGDSNLADGFVAKMESGALGPFGHIDRQSGAIIPGTTVRFGGALPRGIDKAPRSIILSLGRLAAQSTTQPTTQPAALPTTDATTEATTQPGDGLISIGVAGLTPPPAPIKATHDSAPPPAPLAVSTSTEVAYLDKLALVDGAHFVAVFPCTMTKTPWNAIVADISIHQIPSDAAGAATLETLRQGLADATTRAQAGLPLMPPSNVAELQSAIDSLKGHQPLRPPLLFLAMNTDAEIASDFILVADDATLADLRDRMTAALAAQKDPKSLHDLGWVLDRSSLLIMTGLAAKNKLPPEMASVLVLHAGEVGRHPDSLDDILKTIGKSADLKLRLIGENYISLEDSSPGARVRAYDWLKAQGKAPAGFDPMADRKSRRDAINKALASNGGAQ
jgi:hypothetical protein